MSDNEDDPDPFRPKTAEIPLRYQNTLRQHLEDTQTKFTVKVREHVDSKLTEQSTFQEQTMHLKKAFPIVMGMLVAFIIVISLVLPNYLLEGILLFPLVVLATFAINRQRAKGIRKVKIPKIPHVKTPTTLATPATSVDPLPSIDSKVVLPKQKAGHLTIVLLAVSTVACALIYFLNTLLFLPFFAVLLLFYGSYVIQMLRQRRKISSTLPQVSPSVPKETILPEPKLKQHRVQKPQLQKLNSERLTVILLAASTVMCFLFLSTVYFLPFFIMLLSFYATFLFQFRFLTNSALLNMPEAEQMVSAIKNYACWKCGSTDNAVLGSIEAGQIKLSCNKCGTTTTWKKGKAIKKDDKPS